MKTHTDYEQSKKLAKILPIESADMFWYKDSVIKEVNPRVMNYTQIPELQSMYYSPCWSLSALLEVLPKEVNIEGQRYAPCLFPVIDGHWLLKLWYNSNETFTSPIAIFEDNPVDVYYEMIVKLNKLKLL